MTNFIPTATGIRSTFLRSPTPYPVGISVWYMTYSEKLQDPRWQKKRLEIMSRDGFACRKCQSETSSLTVHHFYYVARRNPWEYPRNSMVTICRDCHQEAHKDDSSLRLDFFNSWETSAGIEIARQISMVEQNINHDEVESCKYNYWIRYFRSLGFIDDSQKN
jgi:hypothetical protein